MVIQVRDTGGTQRTITAIQVRDAGNVVRDITEVWVRNSSNVRKQVFATGGGSPLTLSLSPEYVVGIDYGSGTVTTNSTTATPAGGVAPYTYAWTTISYDNPTPPTINSPTAATTTFTQTGVVETNAASFRCTVTDDVGQTAHEDIVATFLNETPP